MTGTTPNVVSLSSPGYSDTHAMNDVQALLASRNRSQGEDAIGEIAEIVERTGRSLMPVRLITATEYAEAKGMTSAVIDAEGISVRAAQDPASGKVEVTITTASPAEYAALAVRIGEREVPLAPYAPDRPGTDRGETAAQRLAEGGAS